MLVRKEAFQHCCCSKGVTGAVASQWQLACRAYESPLTNQIVLQLGFGVMILVVAGGECVTNGWYCLVLLLCTSRTAARRRCQEVLETCDKNNCIAHNRCLGVLHSRS